MDYNNALYHHGVKGMKWGVRRYMNADGSLTPAGKKRYAGDEVGQAKLAYKSAKKEYKKSFNKASNYSSLHPITQYTSKKKKAESDRRWDDAIDKADTVNKVKNDYKQAKTKANKAAVTKYKKKWDEAERAENIADKKWNDVKDSYKALGKNRIERMINASRNKTDAAKKYNKMFDDAERSSLAADAKWRDVKREYQNIGRNRVERMLNVINYDVNRHRKTTGYNI